MHIEMTMRKGGETRRKKDDRHRRLPSPLLTTAAAAYHLLLPSPSLLSLSQVLVFSGNEKQKGPLESRVFIFGNEKPERPNGKTSFPSFVSQSFWVSQYSYDFSHYAPFFLSFFKKVPLPVFLLLYYFF